MDKDKLKAEVIVGDDQLSLAIGKHGQNVRLASRLIGWELDIRTKATAAAVVTAEAVKKSPPLENLPGVGEKTLANLKESGFNTLADILKAKLEDLIKVKGIGQKKAEKLIEEAKKLNKDTK